MSLKIAVFMSWLLGVLSLVVGAASLFGFSGMNTAARISAVWLVIVGLALMVAGAGLSRRHPDAARLAVIVCGLWLVIQVIGLVHHLVTRSHWSMTSWIIVLVEVLATSLIVVSVLRNQNANRETRAGTGRAAV